MAPEQLEGREADARSDIFALGAVLYEMVAGSRAFGADSPARLIASILKEDPRPLSTAQPLAWPLVEHVSIAASRRLLAIAGRRRAMSCAS